jgi:hypothetical protein
MDQETGETRWGFLQIIGQACKCEEIEQRTGISMWGIDHRTGMCLWRDRAEAGISVKEIEQNTGIKLRE